MKVLKYAVIALLCLIVAWVFANLVYGGSPDVGTVTLAVAAILFFLVSAGAQGYAPGETHKKTTAPRKYHSDDSVE